MDVPGVINVQLPAKGSELYNRKKICLVVWDAQKVAGELAVQILAARKSNFFRDGRFWCNGDLHCNSRCIYTL